LLPALLPFQRRSVEWILQREKKTMSQEGSVVPCDPSQFHLAAPPFCEMRERHGNPNKFEGRHNGSRSKPRKNAM
jgi:E3 ubiquitin-protein ligase SHPRH